MTSSFFFIQAEKKDNNREFIDSVEVFAITNKKQIYIIDKPLTDTKYSYDFNNALVLLSPNHKIIFINFGNNNLEFDEFVDDFIEDLGYISDKFKYKSIVGRPRAWKEELVTKTNYNELQCSISRLMDLNLLNNAEKKKKCELLISLLTGSINDIDKVKGNIPDNILDKIKQKIQLFDGDQTRFIYQKLDKKRITIQGLSGTGKTELLLHKLKDIYTSNRNSKVIFTCHNKILAHNLKTRIPSFFDFMKVEEQIKWNERLWCAHSWGSGGKRDTGTYSYICDFYGIQFLRYSPTTTFEVVCKIALDEISNGLINERGHAFDFMLIDESQDFPPIFFDLCETITKNNVYIAGDIFQGIFDDKVISEINPDFLLSKCYRTDPRTLMFAHAVGMGLFETPKLRWLEDSEWKACGYIVNNDDPNKYLLSREPLRRFEDLENEDYSSIELIKTGRNLDQDEETKIINIIKEIIDTNPTVTCNDIGIIFIDTTKDTYLTADKLEQTIPNEFNWNVNIAYESKRKINDTLFISNKNNVKGLEFPFVICITKKVRDTRHYRNALYMMLTRSFLKSYLLISEESDIELISSLEGGLNVIKQKGYIEVTTPTSEEIEFIKTTITYDEEKIPLFDLAHMIFDELDVIEIFKPPLIDAVKALVGDKYDKYDKDEIREIIEYNYSKMVDKNDERV